MEGLIRRSDVLKEACSGVWDIPKSEIDGVLSEVKDVDAVDRAALLKRMFPMGIPKTRYEWDYAINARAVYEAIMKE